MSYASGAYSDAGYSAESGAVSSTPGFTISPTAGHTAGAITVTVQYTNGAVCPASGSGNMPITIQSGGGSVSAATWTALATGANGSGTFSFTEPAASGTPTVFLDSVTSTTQSFDNSAIVPNAPTIGTAVKGNASASVPFTESTDNGGAAITGHTATSTPGGFTGTGSSPITVSGLTNGTSYTFTVHSTNSVGNSPESFASNAVTPSTVPSAPTIGTAVAGSASASVSFTAGANGGSTITSYVATSTPGSHTGIIVQAGSGTILVSGLTNGTPYTFTVHAVNANGNSAESSASNSVTPADVVSILVRAPYLATDTLGTKTFQPYSIVAGALTAIGSGTTTGFSAIPNIGNGWWVNIPLAPNGSFGDSHGIAVFDNINPVTDVPTSTDTGSGNESVTFGSPIGTTGQRVVPDATRGGLTSGQVYYWHATSITTGSFHNNMADAIAGTNKVNLTANIQPTNLTFSDSAAVELYSAPTSTPASLVIEKVSPYLRTDTITTPGYQLYDINGSTSGSHVTSGILPVPGMPNGYVAQISLTPDAAGGAQYGILWDGG